MTLTMLLSYYYFTITTYIITMKTLTRLTSIARIAVGAKTGEGCGAFNHTCTAVETRLRETRISWNVKNKH